MSSHPSLQSLRPLVCSACGRTHAPGESEYACLSCGPAGILEPLLTSIDASEGHLFTNSPGIWRYEHLLTLSLLAPRSPLLVGNTPLLHAERLGAVLGLPYLYIKNETVNPTGSLKDRASAVVLARAAEIGAERVAVASTGNAGSSLAGLAASMGIPAATFVPATAPRAKLIQALMYGAQVFAVQGSYDDAFELCLDACQHLNWYNRKTVYQQSETAQLTLEKVVALEENGERSTILNRGRDILANEPMV